MGIRVRRVAVLSGAVIAVVVAAYGVGKIAASFVNHDSVKLYLSARSNATDELLARMNTIAVGDTIPDHTFQLVNGGTTRLSRHLAAPTLLIFLDPSCPNCLGQAELVTRIAKTPNEQRHFLFVTKADEMQSIKVKTELGIECLILRDADGSFHDILSVHSSPFSILLGANRTAERIFAGELLENEIAEIAESE